MFGRLCGLDDDALDADGVGVRGRNFIAFIPAHGKRQPDGIAGHLERIFCVFAAKRRELPVPGFWLLERFELYES